MDIEKLLKEKGKLIDKEIEAVFPKKDIPNLNDAVYYHLGTGGKHIRPVLAIVTCESLGGNAKQVLPFAAACEILHNWLLIHDDIEDGDQVRRNKPAVWIKYGLAQGVNIGDYMTQKVYELILRSKEQGVDNDTVFKLLKTMVDASLRTSEGQAMEINLRANDNPTEEDYMKMITGKTAHYMTAPVIGGAIVAGREDLLDKVIEFGNYVGPAFQIADDLLDLTEGKGRKEIGCDIKEGKRSLLAIHCLSKCKEKRLIEILNKPVKETTHEDVLFAKQLFEQCGSVDYAKKKADELLKKAKSVIAGTELSFLEEFADYLVNRKK